MKLQTGESSWKTNKTNGDESCSLTAPRNTCVCVWGPSIPWLDELHYFSPAVHPVLNFKLAKRLFCCGGSGGNNNKKHSRCKIYLKIQPSAPARRWSVLIKWNITMDNAELQNAREKKTQTNKERQSRGQSGSVLQRSPWFGVVNPGISFCFL